MDLLSLTVVSEASLYTANILAIQVLVVPKLTFDSDRSVTTLVYPNGRSALTRIFIPKGLSHRDEARELTSTWRSRYSLSGVARSNTKPETSKLVTSPLWAMREYHRSVIEKTTWTGVLETVNLLSNGGVEKVYDVSKKLQGDMRE